MIHAGAIFILGEILFLQKKKKETLFSSDVTWMIGRHLW